MIINEKRANIWKSVNRTRASYFRWANGRSKTQLKKQMQPVLDMLPNNVGQLSDNFIESVITEEAIKELLFDLYFVIGKKFAKSAFAGIVKASFSEDAFAAQVMSSIESDALIMIEDMTLTTKNQLKKIISYGFAEGASIQDTAMLIANDIQTMKLTRAMTIARTETIRASNFGAFQGALMTKQELDKVWITALTLETRGYKETDEFNHVIMDGVKVDMNETFKVPGIHGIEELMYPLALGGSAGNVINCRCTEGFQRK